jgi:hypothetical protein
MVENKLIHRRNVILFSLISIFYFIHVMINISIEGLESVFPPAFLFILFGIVLIGLIYKKINPKITMYVIVGFMYIYFYFLLNNSPYLVNYLFMWLALPLSAIYQSFRVIIIAGIASVILTLYSYFYFQDEIFPNVVRTDVIYLVLFGIFITAFLVTFVHRIRKANTELQDIAYRDSLTGEVPERIADRIKLALENPMEMNDQMIEVSASIGWTYTTDVSDADLENMLKEADRAMYRAKSASQFLDV